VSDPCDQYGPRDPCDQYDSNRRGRGCAYAASGPATSPAVPDPPASLRPGTRRDGRSCSSRRCRALAKAARAPGDGPRPRAPAHSGTRPGRPRRTPRRARPGRPLPAGRSVGSCPGHAVDSGEARAGRAASRASARRSPARHSIALPAPPHPSPACVDLAGAPLERLVRPLICIGGRLIVPRRPRLPTNRNLRSNAEGKANQAPPRVPTDYTREDRTIDRDLDQ
jgi:hypothetical protein